jgi:hypothetical protein
VGLFLEDGFFDNPSVTKPIGFTYNSWQTTGNFVLSRCLFSSSFPSDPNCTFLSGNQENVGSEMPSRELATLPVCGPMPSVIVVTSASGSEFWRVSPAFGATASPLSVPYRPSLTLAQTDCFDLSSVARITLASGQTKDQTSSDAFSASTTLNSLSFHDFLSDPSRNETQVSVISESVFPPSFADTSPDSAWTEMSVSPRDLSPGTLVGASSQSVRLSNTAVTHSIPDAAAFSPSQRFRVSAIQVIADKSPINSPSAAFSVSRRWAKWPSPTAQKC